MMYSKQIVLSLVIIFIESIAMQAQQYNTRDSDTQSINVGVNQKAYKDHRFETKIYDNRSRFNFQLQCSNIPSMTVYGVDISEVI